MQTARKPRGRPRKAFNGPPPENIFKTEAEKDKTASIPNGTKRRRGRPKKLSGSSPAKCKPLDTPSKVAKLKQLEIIPERAYPGQVLEGDNDDNKNNNSKNLATPASANGNVTGKEKAKEKEVERKNIPVVKKIQINIPKASYEQSLNGVGGEALPKKRQRRYKSFLDPNVNIFEKPYLNLEASNPEVMSQSSPEEIDLDLSTLNDHECEDDESITKAGGPLNERYEHLGPGALSNLGRKKSSKLNKLLFQRSLRRPQSKYPAYQGYLKRKCPEVPKEDEISENEHGSQASSNLNPNLFRNLNSHLYPNNHSRHPKSLPPNLYDLLYLAPDCTQNDIKRSFREIVRHLHPDKGGSKEEFIKLRKAYDILNNPK